MFLLIDLLSQFLVQCIHDSVNKSFFFILFFFFKQKTAYEMRISDWSSDVCSSDLLYRTAADRAALAATVHPLLRVRGVPGTHDPERGLALLDRQIGRASCRERVCQYV